MIINLIMIKLPSLKLRRLRSLAIESFKIIVHKSHVYLQSLSNIKSNQCYSFRYTNTVSVPQVRTTSNGLSSFRSGAARLWNSLPQHIREQSNENQFRSLVASLLQMLNCFVLQPAMCFISVIYVLCLFVV